MAATLTAIHGMADVAGMLRRAREADALRQAAQRETDRMIMLARRAGASDLQIRTSLGRADGVLDDGPGAGELREQVIGLERQVAQLRAELEIASAHAGALYRHKISTATKRGLAQRRAAGQVTGRPAVADRPALARRIRTMRADGMTMQAIADVLNAEGVPTARGAAAWRPSSVQRAAGYQRPT